MLRNKIVMGLLASSLLLTGGITAVAAPVSYPLCNVDNCNVAYAHDHDGVTYCGHYLNDGHTYHQTCTIGNCYETSVHSHNDCTYYGHSANYGYSGGHHGGGHHRGGHCR